jgi:hypothetical protein
MTWLTWRQFRVQAAVVGGVVVLLAIFLLVSGLHVLDLYHSCQAAGTCVSGQFNHTDRRLQVMLEVLLEVTPALIGIFWGAPLVARELESGTFRLGWTQSVTRRRWLAVKLGVVGLASVAVCGLLSLMVTWWFSPIDAVKQQIFSDFDVRGFTPLGYAVFAFTLGVTAGTLIRRTVPAMATTLVAFVTTRLAVVTWIRPHLLPAKHTVQAITLSNQDFGVSASSTGPIVSVGAPSIPNAWVYSATLVAKHGHASSTAFIHKACAALIKSLPGPNGVPGPPNQTAFQSCFNRIAANFNQAVTYQPASRYWPLQGMETALFVVLALLLAGVTFWWVRHRVS